MGSALLKSIILIFRKSLISRINEVCFFFAINIAIFYWKKNPHKLHLSRLFYCNHTCYCVNMVPAMSASRCVMSASRYDPRYQSRSSMYIRGLIPRNFAELAEAVPIDSMRSGCSLLVFMLSLSGNNWAGYIEAFNSTFRFLDGLLNIDNPYFWTNGKSGISLRTSDKYCKIFWYWSLIFGF